MKLKTLRFEELLAIKARVEAEIELRIAKERHELVLAIGRLGGISGRVGIRAKGSRAGALRGRKLPPLYRNPENHSETWAGRGNRPRWLKAALKGGGKLEAFAIK